MVAPPLAVADDHEAGAQIGQHRGRHAAGVGALFGGMAILPADLHCPGRNDHRPVDQREGRRDPQAARAAAGPSARHGGNLGDILAQAVHLPVADDQGGHGLSSNAAWGSEAALVASEGPRYKRRVSLPCRNCDDFLLPPLSHQLAGPDPVRHHPGGLCRDRGERSLRRRCAGRLGRKGGQAHHHRARSAAGRGPRGARGAAARSGDDPGRSRAPGRCRADGHPAHRPGRDGGNGPRRRAWRVGRGGRSGHRRHPRLPVGRALRSGHLRPGHRRPGPHRQEAAPVHRRRSDARTADQADHRGARRARWRRPPLCKAAG